MLVFFVDSRVDACRSPFDALSYDNDVLIFCFVIRLETLGDCSIYFIKLCFTVAITQICYHPSSTPIWFCKPLCNIVYSVYFGVMVDKNEWSWTQLKHHQNCAELDGFIFVYIEVGLWGPGGPRC